MATEYSFDVVSKVDMAEVKNALDQTVRELATRFDFRGSISSLELEGESVKVLADDEYRLGLLLDMFRGKLAKRSVSLKSLEYGKIEPASRGSVRQTVVLKQGIPTDESKRIARELKASGLKVSSQIQGEQLRITGKDKDSLQAAQKLILSLEDMPCDVQFINYR